MYLWLKGLVKFSFQESDQGQVQLITKCPFSGPEPEEIKCLKNCFDLFDSKKQDFLSADDLDEILRAMGFRPSKEELMDILAEIDEDGSGEIEFAEFCQLCAKFLVEDPDIDTMKRELKDAFRIYDKDGQGFITMDTLRALIAELLSPLTDEELDGIIAELDDFISYYVTYTVHCDLKR